MASVTSTSLWLAEQITANGLITSYSINTDYPSYPITPVGDSINATATYTKIKDIALTILALLPKYTTKATNPQTGHYEAYYQQKIDSLVYTLLMSTAQDFGTPEFFPEYVNTLSGFNVFDDIKSINTTAWVVYALCEYYQYRTSLVTQPETSTISLSSVEQKIKVFGLDGLLTAQNLAAGQTTYLFASHKNSEGVLSSDRYYLLDSIISLLALLKVSAVLANSSIITEEYKLTIYETIESSYKAVKTHININTGLPYYSISSFGSVDRTTTSSELLVFYGLLLYSFGESTTVYSALDSLVNFDFPKTQLGFAEFIYKFKEIAVGYKAFINPNIEMSDPKISFMSSLLLKKLGNSYEADELVNNLSAYIKTTIINNTEYSYCVFTLDPGAALTSQTIVQPWKSVEATCWSLICSRYKDIFVDGFVNSPWSLSAIKQFTDYCLVDESTGLTLDSDIKVFKKLVDNTYLVVAKYSFPGDERIVNPLLLVSGRDYKFDFADEKFYINSNSIREAFNFIRPSDEFLKYVQFELLFLSRTPEEDTTGAIYSDLTRDGHISKREHSKFNRIIYKKANASTELIKQATTKETFLQIDQTTNQITEVPEKARLFRKDLEASFPPTRTTLHRQPLPVEILSPDEINPLLRYKNQIDYNLFNPLEKEDWKIRVLKNAVYQGSEQVTSGIWTNYFGVSVPRNSTELTIPYTSVDVSPEAQVYSRESLRWKDFLGNMSFSSVYEFLACRKDDAARTSIWTRGSASRIPRPYKSSRRTTGQDGDPVQAFRRDEVLFNRSENISDYEVISTSPDLDSNYLYETKKGAIINRSFFDTTSNILQTLYHSPNTLNFVHKNNITVDKTVTGVTFPITKTSVFKTLITSYKNIYYPVLSKEHERIFDEQNPTLVGTFDRYEDKFNSDFKGALDFTDRSQYYIKILDGGTKKVTTALKKLPYAGNLNLRTCWKSGDLFQDTFDKLTISAGDGAVRYHETYFVDTFEFQLYPFKHETPLILWYHTDTGEVLNYGYYPTCFSNKAYPNVKVRLNGIEIEFNTKWTITSDPVPAIFLILDKENTFTDNKDVLTIEYDALGKELPDQPATAPYQLQTYTQSEEIPSSFFNIALTTNDPVLGKTNIISFTFDKVPQIHWFRNTRGDFINSGNNPTYYYDDVSPNVSIKYNGLELTYLDDWRIDYNFSTLRLVLNNNIGSRVNPLDTFIIEYKILQAMPVEVQP